MEKVTDDHESGDQMRRATNAYVRTDGLDPSRIPTGDVVEHNGKRYVRLINENDSDEILGIYRVRNDGMLKRLKRWPAELAGKEES
jgi:hypothetical protein